MTAQYSIMINPIITEKTRLNKTDMEDRSSISSLMAEQTESAREMHIMEYITVENNPSHTETNTLIPTPVTVAVPILPEITHIPVKTGANDNEKSANLSRNTRVSFNTKLQDDKIESVIETAHAHSNAARI